MRGEKKKELGKKTASLLYVMPCLHTGQSRLRSSCTEGVVTEVSEMVPSDGPNQNPCSNFSVRIVLLIFLVRHVRRKKQVLILLDPGGGEHVATETFLHVFIYFGQLGPKKKATFF